MALFSREMVFDLYVPKLKLGFKYIPEVLTSYLFFSFLLLSFLLRSFPLCTLSFRPLTSILT